MIVTAHQPNLLFAASIVSKIRASDAVILLDEVQFTKGGWTNRQKLPDGSWLTVPVERHCAFQPINRVRIGQTAWRGGVIRDLWRWWPCALTERVIEEVARPYRLLAGLNVAVLRHVLGEFAPDVVWAFQSHLDGGHAVGAVSDDRETLRPISERLAMMVAELGGTTYLSGPSGRAYLSEEPFAARGLAVEYWGHSGPNPCALQLVHQGVTV